MRVQDRTGSILITGGSGFVGGLLKRSLLREGHNCISVDIHSDEFEGDDSVNVIADIRDRRSMAAILARNNVHTIFHAAAILAHDTDRLDQILSCNVDGTRILAEEAKAHGVKRFVLVSTNCLWGKNIGHPIDESEPPCPIEVYGQSKLEAERIVLQQSWPFNVVVLRCPTIIAAGRVGLLALLFDFVQEGRRVWTVGDGSNRYQFIYGHDLVSVCLQLLEYNSSDVFHVGSDNVRSVRETYEELIRHAGTKSQIKSIPRRPAEWVLSMASKLRISPLGPYHYRMISQEFLFDTSKVKQRLGWHPTLSNGEMLIEAYDAYRARLHHRHSYRSSVRSHTDAASFKALRLVKWVS